PITVRRHQAGGARLADQAPPSSSLQPQPITVRRLEMNKLMLAIGATLTAAALVFAPAASASDTKDEQTYIALLELLGVRATAAPDAFLEAGYTSCDALDEIPDAELVTALIAEETGLDTDLVASVVYAAVKGLCPENDHT